MAQLKARRIRHFLNLFLLGLSCIAIRVWYLSIVQYDDHFQSSQRPQRKRVVQPALRGTIRDRFNLPLAMNKVQYNAAIIYSDIRQIPQVSWEKDGKGRRRRVMARKKYIEQLCAFLGEALDLDPLEIEDTIHGRASLFPRTPFVIKEDIPENLFYQLKMCERQWQGVQMQQTGRRVYPMGKCACDILGHMGAINQREYLSLAQEMSELREYLSSREDGKAVFLPKGYDTPLQVRKRLKELEERAFSINDQVGKCGVEGFFDTELRGICGKQLFKVDTRGNPLCNLPGGREVVNGQRLVLSISAELQQTAEQLLASYESFQDKRDSTRSSDRRTPWIRGGSIVAMDPKTGEILALASSPRFDPNDFAFNTTQKKRSEKIDSLSHWLENSRYLASIWEGRSPLEREIFDPKKGKFVLETQFLSWQDFLQTILPKKSALQRSLDKVENLGQAIQIIRNAEELLELSGQESMRATLEELDPSNEKWQLLSTISHSADRVLFLDILRLFVPEKSLCEEAFDALAPLSLESTFELMQITSTERQKVYEAAKKEFHENEFQSWREEHFTQFMREKRRTEKENRRYARPYVDYLHAKEESMFKDYWEENAQNLLPGHLLQPFSDLSLEAQRDILSFLRPFSALNRPLWGKYAYLRNEGGISYEKHLASAFYPYSGFGYGRSTAFRMSTPMGSIFKLIPAYAGLKERFHTLNGEIKSLDDLNPITLTDSMQAGARIMGHFESGEVIKRMYKGGSLPRSPSQKGRIDIRGAIERTSNIYFPILASDFLPSPNYLKEVAQEFGFGEKTGIDLPGEYGGNLPDDLAHNKTSLYAFSIGQHSLVGTPLQTAVMFSTIANGGKVLKPQIVKLSAGKQPESINLKLPPDEDYPYKKYLDPLGISFPIFTEALKRDPQGFINWKTPEIVREVEMPQPVREMLLEGMSLVTKGARGTARPSAMRAQYQTVDAMKSYRKIADTLYSKTGTAEILYKQTIDAQTPPSVEKHVWFGTISFKDEAATDPELVVVVYLRFGVAGNQGAPMAARIIEKWREIN